MNRYDRLWERLIEHLSEWATMREVPGGIELTYEHSPGVTRTVEIVITQDDWDTYISTIFGTGDPRATGIRREVLAMPDEFDYLVYDTCDFHPAQTRDLSSADDSGDEQHASESDPTIVIGPGKDYKAGRRHRL